MTKWVEVWGVEAGGAEPELLFKIPAEQWDAAAEAETRRELAAVGTTGVEVKEVEDSTP